MQLAQGLKAGHLTVLELEFLTRGGHRTRLVAIIMFEMRVGYAKIWGFVGRQRDA